MYLRKLVYSGLICSLLVSGLGISQSSFALDVVDSNIEQVEERFTYRDSANCRLSISPSGVANVASSVIGQSMVTKTEVTARLQQYVNGYWQNIQMWTVSSNDKTCTLSKTYSVKKRLFI